MQCLAVTNYCIVSTLFATNICFSNTMYNFIYFTNLFSLTLLIFIDTIWPFSILPNFNLTMILFKINCLQRWFKFWLVLQDLFIRKVTNVFSHELGYSKNIKTVTFHRKPPYFTLSKCYLKDHFWELPWV